jgi:hypothetical protein
VEAHLRQGCSNALIRDPEALTRHQTAAFAAFADASASRVAFVGTAVGFALAVALAVFLHRRAAFVLRS